MMLLRCIKRIIVLLLAVIIVQLTARPGQLWPKAIAGGSKVRYDNGSLKVTANNADLREVLSALAQRTKIPIYYHADLNKKVTVSWRGTSVGQVLKKILKGVNHIILYAGPDPKDATISKVLVFKKGQGYSPPTASERRIARRMKSYKRQIESLRHRRSKLTANNPAAKRYDNRIRILERKIQHLYRQ